MIRDGVRMKLVHGKHRRAVFGERCQDIDPQFDWASENIEVFVTILADCIALSSVYVMKNSSLLNTASSNALPCVDFLDVIRALIAYPERLMIICRSHF